MSQLTRHILPRLLVLLLALPCMLSCQPYSEEELDEVRKQLDEEGWPEGYDYPYVKYDMRYKDESHLKYMEEKIDNENVLYLDINIDFDEKGNIYHTNFDGLYNFVNVVAVYIYIYPYSERQLLQAIDSDGSIIDSANYRMYDQIDLSQFKNLHYIMLTADSTYREEVDLILSKLDKIGGIEIHDEHDRITIPEQLLEMDSVGTLRLKHTHANWEDKLAFDYPEDFAKMKLGRFEFRSEQLSSTYEKQYRTAFAKKVLGYLAITDTDSILSNYEYSYAHKSHLKDNILAEHRFFSEVFRMESLHEIRLTHALVDSIPPEIGNMKNLRKLELENCFVSHLPEGIRRLEKLRELKMYIGNEYARVGTPWAYLVRDSLRHSPHRRVNDLLRVSSRPRFAWLPPNLSIAGSGGFRALEFALFHNVSFGTEFPDLSQASSLRQLSHFGDFQVRTFPDLSASMDLELLEWHRTQARQLPDHLNGFPLRLLNLDDDYLESVDNVKEAGTSADYFSYDINQVPYSERKKVNEYVAKKRGTSFPLPKEKPEEQALYDSIYYEYIVGVLQYPSQIKPRSIWPIADHYRGVIRENGLELNDLEGYERVQLWRAKEWHAHSDPPGAVPRIPDFPLPSLQQLQLLQENVGQGDSQAQKTGAGVGLRFGGLCGRGPSADAPPARGEPCHGPEPVQHRHEGKGTQDNQGIWHLLHSRVLLRVGVAGTLRAGQYPNPFGKPATAG